MNTVHAEHVNKTMKLVDEKLITSHLTDIVGGYTDPIDDVIKAQREKNAAAVSRGFFDSGDTKDSSPGSPKEQKPKR